MWTQTSTAPSRFKTTLDDLTEDAARHARQGAAAHVAAVEAENEAFVQEAAADHRAYDLAKAKPRRAGLLSKLALAGAALGTIFMPYTAKAEEPAKPVVAVERAPEDLTRRIGTTPAAPLRAEAAEASSPAFTYFFPVHASAPGANGSQWETDEACAVLGGEPAEITVTRTLRGATASPSDPTITFTVPGGDSFTLKERLAGVQGVYNLTMTSTQRVDCSKIYVYNQSPNRSQQGQGYSVLLPEDAHWAERGDKITYIIPDTTAKRINFGGLVKGQGNLTWTLKDEHNQLITGGSAGFNNQSFQYSPLSAALGGVQANKGDILTVTVGSDGGATPMYAQPVLNVVDNAIPESQDPYTDEGSIDRLLEQAEYRILPTVAEVNDPFTSYVHVKVREGATITAVHLDWDGDGSYEEHHTGLNTNDYTLQQTGTWLAAGPTWHGKLQTVIRDEQGIEYTRNTNGGESTVNEERDIALPFSSIRSAFEQNLTKLAAHFATYGFYPDGNDPEKWYHKTEQTWVSVLTNQLNNITEIRWRDKNNSIVFQDWIQPGNIFQVYIKGPESAMDYSYELLTTPQP